MANDPLAAVELWARDHQGIAAWVQALGTPLALALTVWATTHSTWTARRLALAGPDALYGALLSPMRGLKMTWLDDRPVGPDALLDAAAETDRHLQELDGSLNLPPNAWPDVNIRIGAQAVRYSASAMRTWARSAVEFAGEDFASWPQSMGRSDAPAETLRTAAANLAMSLDDLMSAVIKARRELGLSVAGYDEWGSGAQGAFNRSWKPVAPLS